MYTFYHSWGDYGILDSIRTGQSILSGQELGGKEEGRREEGRRKRQGKDSGGKVGNGFAAASRREMKFS